MTTSDTPEIVTLETEPRHRRFQRIASERFNRNLYLPEDIEVPDFELPSEVETNALKSSMRWMREFIMRPHPNLGRTGPVCPFVKPAIDDHLLYFSVNQAQDPMNFKSIYDEMMHYKDIFNTFEPFTGPLSELRVIMFLCPLSHESVLSDPHESKMLKSDMMKEGITVGQFFPTSDVKRMLRDKFFPVQPPVCMYSMRTFIPGDWMFISGEPEWRKIYKDRFGEPKL